MYSEKLSARLIISIGRVTTSPPLGRRLVLARRCLSGSLPSQANFRNSLLFERNWLEARLAWGAIVGLPKISCLRAREIKNLESHTIKQLHGA